MLLTPYVRTFGILFFVLQSLYCSAQREFYKSRDYRKADSIAAATRMAKGEKYVQVAHRLADGLPTEEEKFRAIFRWVCDHLEYAEGNYSTDPGQLLKQGKAVCIGYAMLLKDMCTEVGLECKIITGYARNAPDDIGKRLKKLERHAWNAINLGGQWYLCDATWASGYYNKKTKKYTRRYDDSYFISNPDFFARTHYPEEKKWQLLDKKMTKRKFLHSPVIWSGYDSLGITRISGRVKRLTLVSMPVRIRYRQEKPGAGSGEKTVIGVAVDPEGKYGGSRTRKKDNGETRAGIWLYKRGKNDVTVFVNHKAVATYRVRAWGKDPDKIEARYEKRQKKRERRAKKRNG